MPHDIVIVGGGIAGLSAGLAAASLGRTTLILTGDLLGGQLTSINRIDFYPGLPQGIAGYELLPHIQEQASDAGADFEADNLASLSHDGAIWHLVTGSGDAHQARAVILATGAAPNPLDIPGETRLLGHGVSHCASCDGPMFRNQPVAVIGGGDSALQEALTLAEFARHITIIQDGPTLTAQATYQTRVKSHPKIGIRHNTTATEIIGDTAVTAVGLSDGTRLEVAAIFPCIGLTPSTAYLGHLLPPGPIQTVASLQTSLPNLYAAGSVRFGFQGRALLAAAEGTAAALNAHNALNP